MIVFPAAAQEVVLSVYESLWAKCSKESAELGGQRWVFTEVAHESLSILMSLACVSGEMSISDLADMIKDADFDFSDDVELV